MTTQLLEKPEATNATATLYTRHHRRIRGYCLGQLRDRQEADDAVQSTFLYALSSLQRGVTPHNELPWLYAIAHNVCRTRMRSLRRRSRFEAAVDLDSVCETTGRDDSAHDDVAALASALNGLPPNQRRALLLREWQGLSYAEVAARMGLTESAVEAVLFRARRNVAQRLRIDRVASAGAFIAGNLRRLGSLLGLGKASAAAIAVGLAAGTAIPPLVASADRAGRAPARVVRASHVVREPNVRPATIMSAAPVRLWVKPKRQRVAVPTHVPRVATPIVRTPQSVGATHADSNRNEPMTATSQPPPPAAAAEAQPEAASAPAEPSPPPSTPAARARESSVVVEAPNEPTPVAEPKKLVPPQVEPVVSSLPVPPPPALDDVATPSLPVPSPKDVTNDITSVVPAAIPTPAVPGVPNAASSPAPDASALPNAPLPTNQPVSSVLPDHSSQSGPVQLP